MAAKLPSITDVERCPHCGHQEFQVAVRYSGRGVYRRRFDGKSADNTEMYDCLNSTEGKIAYCDACYKPVARWDQNSDGRHYGAHA